jgi:hypothetical protein
MRFITRAILIIAILFASEIYSQEKGTGPREKSFKEELKSNRDLRRERRAKRKQEKAEQKAIKAHHKRIQTKAVRKRMKQSRGKSTRYNENKREPFFKRLFRKKGKRSGTPRKTDEKKD